MRGKSRYEKFAAVQTAIFSVGQPCVVVRAEGINGEIVTVRKGRILIGYDPDEDSFPDRTLDPPR